MRTAKTASPHWREAVIRQSLHLWFCLPWAKHIVDVEWQPPWNCALIILSVCRAVPLRRGVQACTVPYKESSRLLL